MNNKSGIYRLIFNDGSTYIGKSNDISRRWKEHADKFVKGKAASNMQQAYRTCGFPNTQILLYCHEDHIDIMETYFIRQLRPNLNSASTVNITSTEERVLSENLELLDVGTASHILNINQLRINLGEVQESNNRLKNELLEVKSKLNKQVIARMGRQLIIDLVNKMDAAKEVATKYKERVDWLELPWWKRWFS